MKPFHILVGLAFVLLVVPIWLTRADDQPVSPGPSAAVEPRPEDAAERSVPKLDGDIAPGMLSKGEVWRMLIPPGPPSEEEVWLRLGKPAKDRQRDNVRILIEKKPDKADPVKVYPLAGPCQLVHRLFKCTVYFDERPRQDRPVPSDRVDHVVKTVPSDPVDHVVRIFYVGKNFLRRASTSGQPDNGPDAQRVESIRPAEKLDEQLERIGREIELLKRMRARDRREQERVIDRLIKELEGLKRDPVKAVSDAEAEKAFRVAMYYKRIGKAAAADFYFNKIPARWPESAWAGRAKEERAQTEPERVIRTGGGFFNSVVGGLY